MLNFNIWSLQVTWGTNSLTFNCTLCPHCFIVFCIYLRTNSDLCHLQHKLIGFYNRDEKCLQRGTDWSFKCFVIIWEQTATWATYKKLICFYSWDEKCLRRGTDWVFK
jgi:hypothetical protein